MKRIPLFAILMFLFVFSATCLPYLPLSVSESAAQVIAIDSSSDGTAGYSNGKAIGLILIVILIVAAVLAYRMRKRA